MSDENPDIISRLLPFFDTLLKQASETNVPVEGQPAGLVIGFIDRLKLLDAGIKLAALQHRVTPGDEDKDEFSRARDSLNGRARGRGARSASSPTNGGASGRA